MLQVSYACLHKGHQALTNSCSSCCDQSVVMMDVGGAPFADCLSSPNPFKPPNKLHNMSRGTARKQQIMLLCCLFQAIKESADLQGSCVEAQAEKLCKEFRGKEM